MAGQKIIAVVGATGAQGGGLCRAVLQDRGGGYRVRAMTRNPDSPKAKELAEAGAEVVTADLDDLESLKKAFHCVHAAFCVTAFWEHFSPEKELNQAKNMAEAAKHARVRHVVWSTLEDTRKWVPLSDDRMPTLMGSYKVPHFDAKGEADAIFGALGVPVTLLRTSFYWDNLIHFGMGPRRGADGTLAITFPMGDKKLPGIAAEDIGHCAYNIFRNPGEFIGKTVGIAGDHLTGAQMAVSLSRALGEEVRYNDVPPEVYRAFGFPGAEDLGNMFQFKRDFEAAFCGARSLESSRRLYAGLQTFDEWLSRNKHRIPIEPKVRQAGGGSG
ncbi:MAG: NmrA/HSCARG family protein [Verrucomicrobiota bacterium]